LAALALVAVFAAVRAFSPSKKSEPRFIVVQADPRVSVQAQGEAQASAREPSKTRERTSMLPSALAEQPAPNADTPAGTASLKRTNASADAAEALAQSFRAQRASIVRCVNTYPSEVEQSPKLTLRLSLSAQGAVSDAKLSPAELSGTPLSACIEAAARSLKFPKQAGPIVFDVPLTARKGG
jgi:hypothetical protein